MDRSTITAALCLRETFPTHVALQILSYAYRNYPIPISSKTSSPPVRIRQSNSPHLYITATIPPPSLSIPQGSIHGLQFKITSHDQGWSSYRQDHGTFDNSWTWFDVVVRDSPTSTTNSNMNETGPFTPTPTVTISRSPEVDVGKRLTTNVHASANFHEQTITWSLTPSPFSFSFSDDDESFVHSHTVYKYTGQYDGHEIDVRGKETIGRHTDDELREIIERIQTGRGGQVVEIRANACFAGWENVLWRIEVGVLVPAIRRL